MRVLFDFSLFLNKQNAAGRPRTSILLPAACALVIGGIAAPAWASENPLLSIPHLNLPQNAEQPAEPQVTLRGWDHLYEKMVEQGADPLRLKVLFSDPRMPQRKPLYFAVEPNEPKSMYRAHNTARARQQALRFHLQYYDWFQEAEQRFNVPQEVILSIIQIESKCGTFTGRSPVFYRLARLASAAHPENIDNNFRVKYAGSKGVAREDVKRRAEWLEETFLPHAIAALELADRLQIHPLELKGSPAGALGLPQFLPGNIETHGLDADQDGIIDLFNPPDAIYSVARFLANHGWQPDTKTRKEQHKIIYHYNRSNSYVSTVLTMASSLRPQVLKRKAAYSASPTEIVASAKE